MLNCCAAVSSLNKRFQQLFTVLRRDYFFRCRCRGGARSEETFQKQLSIAWVEFSGLEPNDVTLKFNVCSRKYDFRYKFQNESTCDSV